MNTLRTAAMQLITQSPFGCFKLTGLMAEKTLLQILSSITKLEEAEDGTKIMTITVEGQSYFLILGSQGEVINSGQGPMPE